nr:tRNA lysidine(34) synthetase TilS [Sphingobium sp. SCG-1]
MADDQAFRFRQSADRLTGSASSSRYGIAVSGGPDSMALLWLAHQAFSGQVEAATVDHGLRSASADEAAMVAAYCADIGVPHRTLHPSEPITGNIQSAARLKRYALLEDWRAERGLDWLMTAHHADDQLETMLMRLNRGSGVSGLAGVRTRSGAILRPLLGWRKAELQALVETKGMPFVHDPSNVDERFDRASLRKRLADADWLDPLAATRSAAALADAEEALQWMMAELCAEHLVHDGDRWILKVTGFPREIQRRLIIRMLEQAEPEAPPPRGDALDAALVHLNSGGKAMLGNWLFTGGKSWTLSRAPARRH